MIDKIRSEGRVTAESGSKTWGQDETPIALPLYAIKQAPNKTSARTSAKSSPPGGPLCRKLSRRGTGLGNLPSAAFLRSSRRVALSGASLRESVGDFAGSSDGSPLSILRGHVRMALRNAFEFIAALAQGRWLLSENQGAGSDEWPALEPPSSCG